MQTKEFYSSYRGLDHLNELENINKIRTERRPRMAVEQNLYYKVDFTLGPRFKTNVSVSLTSDAITYESESTKTNEIINLGDVIGAKVSSASSPDGVESAFIHIFSYPLRKRKLFKVARRHRIEYVFGVSGRDNSGENLEIAEQWVRCIKWLLTKNSDVNLATIYEDYPPKQQFLIFINPFGGRGSASKLFERKVKPMLEEADVDYELLVTGYMGHAKEIIQNMEVLKKFDCIVCCSGDGIINEVINGLMSRPDWQEAIKTPIGHVPCGSGNGLCAAALYHSGEPFDMTSSVFTLLTGEEFPLDILKAETAKAEAQYSFLSIVFGIVADVDIESEKYRYMGDFRFDMMGSKKILQRRSFSGKISYLPVDDDICADVTTTCNLHVQSNSNRLNGDEIDELSDGAINCKEGTSEQLNLEDGVLELEDANMKDGKLKNGILEDGNLDTSKSDPADEFVEIPVDGNVEHINLKDEKLDVNLSDDILDSGTVANGIPNRILPDFHEPIPESWKVIEGDFVGWLFVSTSHIGKDVFCAPDATFGDGIIHCMCLSGDISRLNLFKVLSKLGRGEHVNVRGVHMIKARAFRLEPYSTSSKIITIDGERVEFGKTQAELYRSLGRVRCRPPAGVNQ